MSMGAKPVLRERDGMVTSAAPEGGKPGWQQPQSVAAESGPARNEDPSDWCLPPALPAPPCLPACLPPACACACLFVSGPRLLLYPRSWHAIARLRLEQSRPGLGLGLRLVLVGFGLVPWVHTMPCGAMRQDGMALTLILHLHQSHLATGT